MNSVIDQAFPGSVTFNWSESHRLAARDEFLTDSVLPRLSDQVAQLRTAQADLLAEYEKRAAEINQQIKALTTEADAVAAERDSCRENAETGREMVQLWCEAHGHELPPLPLAAVERPAQESAEALGQAATPELGRTEAPAWPATDQTPGPAETVVDGVIGGDQAAAAAPFHPDTPDGGRDA